MKLRTGRRLQGYTPAPGLFTDLTTHHHCVSLFLPKKSSETLSARRDNKPISANNAVTQLSLRIVLSDQDMLPKSLWILLAVGEVCCVNSRQDTAGFSVRERTKEMAAYCCVVIKSQVTLILSSLSGDLTCAVGTDLYSRFYYFLKCILLEHYFFQEIVFSFLLCQATNF